MAKAGVLQTVVDRSTGFRKYDVLMNENEDDLTRTLIDLFGEEGGRAGKVFLWAAKDKAAEALAVLEDFARKLARERGDNDQVLDVRDVLTRKVYDHAVGVRSLCSDTFGTKFLDDMSLVGTTADDPAGVLELGTQLVEGLRKVKLPKPLRRAVTVDVQMLADDLEVDVLALRDAVNASEAEKVQEKQLVIAKNAAQKKYDRHYMAAGDAAALIFELGGNPEMARQVKASRRQPGRSVADVEDAPEATDVVDPGVSPVVPAPASEEDVA